MFSIERYYSLNSNLFLHKNKFNNKINMRCEGCLKKEQLFLCFFKGKKHQGYFCAKCLAKKLLEDPSTIYSMSKIDYTWKEK